jgi:hypothetical protein
MKSKTKLLFLLYAVVLLLSAQIAYGDITRTLTFNPEHFSIQTLIERDGQEYSVITSIDKSVYQNGDSIGNPQLPEEIVCFSLPPNQEIDHIIINDIAEIPLANVAYPIRPIQADWQTSVSAVQPAFEQVNQAIYRTNEMYPRRTNQVIVVRQDYVRGAKIVSLRVKPVRYNPVTSEVVLAQSIDLTLVTRQSADYSVVPRQQSQNAERLTLSLLRTVVRNEDELPANIPHIPHIKLKPGQGYPTPAVPPECIVITDYSLVHEFSKYGEWLTQRGIPTSIVDVTSIYRTYQGVDNQEKIRNYIIDQYRQYGLCYVVLGGNLRIIPGRLCDPYDTDHLPGIYSLQICDLYYADVDGVWDFDGDGIYGEITQDQADMGADVFVGRVPASTEAEVKTWVEKRLRYEKNPGNGHFDYLSNAVVSSADQMRDLGQYRDICNIFPAFFQVDTTALIEQPDGGAYNPVGPSGLDVVNYFSTNHPAIYVSENHGSPDYFAVRSQNYNGAPRSNFCSNTAAMYNYDDGLLDAIETDSMDYLHFSIACDLGMMDCLDAYAWWTRYPCYAQADLFSPGGSVTGRYNTRWGWVFASHPIELSFYNVLFSEEGQHCVSFAHYMTKLMNPAVRDIDFGNTLFGCPVLTAWTHMPQEMSVKYPGYVTLVQGSNIDVAIQVKSNSMPLSGVSVTLWKGLEVYATGVTNINGWVTLTIRPQTAGSMILTCAKPNYLPFQTTIDVSQGFHVGTATYNNSKTTVFKQCLIWNPHQLPSGDSLFSTLMRAGQQVAQTSVLSDYVDSLSNYTLYVIGGIYEYGEVLLTAQEVEPVLPYLIYFLSGGNGMYWEGAYSLGNQPQSLKNYFSFDIYLATQNPATYFRGIDTLFWALDSIGYDEGLMAADAIGHYPNNVGNVIESPENNPPYNTKAVINNKTMVSNFSWAKLNDCGRNTRVELANAICERLQVSGGIMDGEIPREYELLQNYPNPFNSSTVLSFGVPVFTHVKLDIYNILGQRVATLTDADYRPGTYRITWNTSGSDVASGVYFAVLCGDKKTKIVKMSLFK